jgi:hypothetical protein
VARSIKYDDYHFERGVDVMELAARLSNYGELSSDSGMGVRFEPDSTDWPSTYFAPDGSIHLVTTGMGLNEVTTYICRLSEIVGVEIVESTVGH